MKTIVTLVFSLIAILFVSCEKSGKDISVDVDLTVLNQQGQNLLAAPAVYTKDNIDLQYVVNGQAQLSQNNFNIINEGTSRMQVYLNYDINRKETITLTLVKFGTSKIDTIKGEFDYEGRSVSLRKVWFNGILKPREFSIIK